VAHFPQYKRPKDVYPQWKLPTREPSHTSKQAEYSVKSLVFKEYKGMKFFYWYDLKMDDLPANTEVATVMLNLASDV